MEVELVLARAWRTFVCRAPAFVWGEGWRIDRFGPLDITLLRTLLQRCQDYQRLMAGLVLRCYYTVDVSMKSVDHPNSPLLFALLVVSKVPFEDMQVRPYIAPSLHRFTALMKSHQILPAIALSRRCCPLLAVPARLDGSGYSLFLMVFSGVLSIWKEVQLCPAFDR